LKAEGS